MLFTPIRVGREPPTIGRGDKRLARFSIDLEGLAFTFWKLLWYAKQRYSSSHHRGGDPIVPLVMGPHHQGRYCLVPDSMSCRSSYCDTLSALL